MSPHRPPAAGRRLVVAVACCVALALTGCGGGDDTQQSDRAKDKPAIGELEAPKVQAGLLGDAVSAGDAESYEPTGEIIADSGFRPEVDGFSFENYGNDVGPQNMTTASMQALFGDEVCVGGESDDCTLRPTAQRWMDSQNERMGGGHCMGFSVAAIRMFIDTLAEKDFGADTTAELEIQGNTALQESIAEHWVYQDLPKIRAKTVSGAPSAVLQRLVDTLNSGKEDYTVGIFMADGSGGHAITPFAVEDRGGDRYKILVYDNNYPGITRAIDVDIEKETWRYVGGTNPQNLGEVYTGDADTESMVLLPTSPGEDVQPCPFCQGEGGSPGAGFGSAGDDTSYSQITLNGPVRNHPHLVLTDEEGRTTGIVDGELVNEIPGVKVVQTMSVQNWDAAPEPSYQVPAGKDILVAIDGSSLEKAADVSIDLAAGGLVVAIDELRVRPGQVDELVLSGNGNGLYYATDSTSEETPEFYAGVDDGDDSYTFAAAAVGLKRGSQIGLVVDQESKTVLLDADGAKAIKGSGGDVGFVLLVGKATADGTRLWGTDELFLSAKKREGAYFSYAKTPKAGDSLPLEVGPENGPFRTVKAPYQP